MGNFPFSWRGHRFRSGDAYAEDPRLGQNSTDLRAISIEDLKDNERKIRQELLRQARWSFNLAIFSMFISSVISIAGICLLLSGKGKEGALTAIGGLASYIVPANCLSLTEKANNRIDKILRKTE